MAAPGSSRSQRPGKKRSISAPPPRLVTFRASNRPKKISTRGRATCVERVRSLGSWKVPTFSEREWRRAVDAAEGMNGSCTCTMSRGTDASRVSTVRLTSRGTVAARGPSGTGSAEPIASTGGPSPPRRVARQVDPNAEAGRSRASRISLRDSRTAARESDGAAISTWWPRSESSAATLPANSLTSLRASHGWGENWAIDRGFCATPPEHSRAPRGYASASIRSLAVPAACAALRVRA